MEAFLKMLRLRRDSPEQLYAVCSAVACGVTEAEGE